LLHVLFDHAVDIVHSACYTKVPATIPFRSTPCFRKLLRKWREWFVQWCTIGVVVTRKRAKRSISLPTGRHATISPPPTHK